MELAERDVVLAHLWTLLQVPLVRLLVGVNVLLQLGLTLRAVRAAARGEPASPALLFGALVLATFFVVVPLAVVRRARRRFRGLSEPERHGNYTFTPEGFAWTLGPAPGSVPWAAVHRFQETRSYLFFLTPSYRTHVLPKAQAGQEALRRLHDLIGGLATG